LHHSTGPDAIGEAQGTGRYGCKIRCPPDGGNWNPIPLESNASICCYLHLKLYSYRYQARALELSQREIIYTKYPEMAFLLLVILGSIYRERMMEVSLGVLGLICVEPLGLSVISDSALLFLVSSAGQWVDGFFFLCQPNHPCQETSWTKQFP
jgi:hypothetical protein